MRILFLGDIMGRGGRRVVSLRLPHLIKKEKIDFCVANCENLSGGKGITIDKIEEMRKAGVDFFTSGNHIWSNKKVFAKLDDVNFPVIRPANYPDLKTIPGRGYDLKKINKTKVLIINLIGRVFMVKDYDCPFRRVDQILDQTKKEKPEVIIVDFHAEATSEKIALKHYLDSRITMFIGTHTHVPTADAQITGSGMAYITDVGMCGPTDSVIGMNKEVIIESFLTQLPPKYDIAVGESELSGVIVEIEGKKAKSIKMISQKEGN
jgi:hypothetical protein